MLLGREVSKPNLPSRPRVPLQEIPVGVQWTQGAQIAEHVATLRAGGDLRMALQEEIDLVEEARIDVPLAQIL
jgi:hypothetical protein